MADTIENRVYLFESLASSYVTQAAGLLGSRSAEERARALRALADLAYVSCAVADTAELTPAEVRQRILDGAAGQAQSANLAGRARRKK